MELSRLDQSTNEIDGRSGGFATANAFHATVKIEPQTCVTNSDNLASPYRSR